MQTTHIVFAGQNIRSCLSLILASNLDTHPRQTLREACDYAIIFNRRQTALGLKPLLLGAWLKSKTWDLLAQRIQAIFRPSISSLYLLASTHTPYG